MIIPLRSSALQSLVHNPRIEGCICDPHRECVEAGKISWDNCPGAYFFHVRFDGCICTDLPEKRCDCIIFRFLSGSQAVMFAIEVKEGNPNLREVQAKIQYCVDIMISLLPNPKNQFVVIPVLCARAFCGLNYRAILSYRIKVFGEKMIIRKRFHHQDINSL